MSISIDDILQAAEEHQASDIFLQEGEVPRMKINEQLMIFGDEPLLLPQMAGLWQACGGDSLKDTDVDTGIVSRSGIRFRVNLHKVLGRLASTLRRIRSTTGATIVAILREKGSLATPHPDEVLRAGDTLVVIGRPETFKDIRKLVDEGPPQS